MAHNSKRINLSVPEAFYRQIALYRERNGLSSDAGACLQLIILQLRAQDISSRLQREYAQKAVAVHSSLFLSE